MLDKTAGDHVSVTIEMMSEVDTLAVPAYASDGASGLDLLAVENTRLEPMQRALLRTGIKMVLPAGYEAQVRPRSGLAIRHGITVLNSPGTIDQDYRGEIKVPMINLGQDVFFIKTGMRFAQIVISPVSRVTLCVGVVEKTSSQRGEGGFGSTGLE